MNSQAYQSCNGAASPPPSPSLARSSSRARTVSLLGRLRRAAIAGLDLILLWIERHRSRRQLRTLDDRLLGDIGVTRAQAEGEADKPFWRP